MVYLPVMLVSFALMVPFIIIGEKRAQLRPVFLIAIALIGISEAVLWDGHDSLWLLSLGLLIFFTGFNVMEASLPSLIAKFAPAHLKGTASGVYATSQFLGSFVGGVLGGALLGWGGFDAVFSAAVMLTLVWFAVAWGMGNPDRLSSFVLPLMPEHTKDVRATRLALMEIDGVREAWVDEVGVRAYMKIDRSLVDEASLIHWAASKND